MPHGRFSLRYQLPAQPAPRNTPDPVIQQQHRDINVERLAQFPLENAAREAQLARAQSAEAQSRYKLQKEIETDRQKAAFYNGLQEVESYLNSKGYKIGTKEHAEAFASYAHEFPLARSTKSVQDTLKLHSLVNDDQAALTQRMSQSIEAGKQLGLEPQGASFIKGGQVDVRFKQPDQGGPDFEDELQKDYKLSPGQFAAHVNAQLVNAKGEGDNAGNLIKFTAGESNKGEAQTHTMTLPEFNRFATAFGMQPIQQQAPPPTPASGIQAATNYGQQVGAQPDITPAPVVQPSATPDQTPIYTPSPSPEATATPATTPQFEPRTINGVTYQWSGKQWEPQDQQ